MSRIVTRKSYAPVFYGPSELKQALPKCRWLQPTVENTGRISTPFMDMAHQLNQLNSEKNISLIKNFKDMLSIDHNEALNLWKQINEVKYDKNKPIKTWKDMPRHYGPHVLTTALSHVALHAKRTPQLLEGIFNVKPDNEPPLHPFTLGFLMNILGSTNIELCKELMKIRDWSTESKTLGATALLLQTKMNPSLFPYILKWADFPKGYKFPPAIVHYLCGHSTNEQVIEMFETYLQFLNPKQPIVDRFLRLVFTGSDAGEEQVLKNMTREEYPFSIIPMLNSKLCQKYIISNNKEASLKHWESVFSTLVDRYGHKRHKVLLHMLMKMCIQTNGVSSTSTILGAFANNELKITEETWLLIFQYFRYSGMPEKCVFVLRKTLEEYPKLSLPFISEYLSFVGRFCNLRNYMQALETVIPEAMPILKTSELSSYIESKIPISTGIPLIEYPKLTTENRNFEVGDKINATIINITYKVVIPTIEDLTTATQLFERYIELTSRSKSPLSSRIVDEFVQLIIHHPLTNTEGHIANFETKIQVATEIMLVFFKNMTSNSRVVTHKPEMLKIILKKLMQMRRTDLALKVIEHVTQNCEVQIEESSLQPWLNSLSLKTRSKFLELIKSRKN